MMRVYKERYLDFRAMGVTLIKDFWQIELHITFWVWHIWIEWSRRGDELE